MNAIGTIYKNVIFRSRLEARHAVFFDEFGLEWEYEPETFKLKSGLLYSPDFYFPELECYAEVKPLVKTFQEDYHEHIFDENHIWLKEIEYRKLIEFELPIVLLAGLPLERNWILFDESGKHYLCVYPCRDWKRVDGETIDFFRWWACCSITDFPAHRDIEEPARISRYYNFFNY